MSDKKLNDSLPKFALGALPPPEMEWQLGKTVEAIKFVRDSEEAIERLSNSIKKLRKIIDEVKDGKREIDESMTPMSVIFGEW